MRTTAARRGFSLLELLLSLALTLVIGLAGIQLFRISERLLGDTSGALEIQQALRAVSAQIAREIRMAGQGLPQFLMSSDESSTEANVVVMSGSDLSHLRLRGGIPDIETSVLSQPALYVMDQPLQIQVENAVRFSGALNTTAPAGRFVFLSGTGEGACEGWIRAELNAIDPAAALLTVTPRQAGGGCDKPDGSRQFTSPQALSLEQGTSLYLSAGSLWRASATSMATPSNPAWGQASELARGISNFHVVYRDPNGNSTPTQTAADRRKIIAIEVAIEGAGSGGRPGFLLVFSTAIRNSQLF